MRIEENNYLKFIIGIFLGILGFLSNNVYLSFILIFLAYFILLLKIIKEVLEKKCIDEDFLVLIATIGAFIIGERIEGFFVILLYEIGEFLEDKALDNTKKQLEDLLKLKPISANLMKNKELVKVSPENLKINDIIIVLPGEEIPVDGIVLKGNSKLDMSSLTGESEAVSVSHNTEVLSGSLNLSGKLEIKVTTLYENSTVKKMVDLVMNAANNKSNMENYVSKLAKVYTPIICLLAILILFLPIFGILEFKTSIYKALTFLVISCPCAIVISVPLSYFRGLGILSKKGVLIKGSNYLDNLGLIKTIVFDKTGTLTNGEFKVEKLEIIDKKYQEKEIKEIFISGEIYSNHPIAKCIVKFCEKSKKKSILDYEEIAGKGISFKLNKDKVLIGNDNLVSYKENINKTKIYLKVNDKVIASLIISDGIKNNTKELISFLKSNNINVSMLTGDNRSIALEIAKRIGIKEVVAGALPTDKYNYISDKMNNKEIVAFVGDGINDASVLLKSDIGISMGSIGSNLANECSDIVIMNDDLLKIKEAILISKKTKKIIKENLFLAFFIKIVVLSGSVLGVTNMWLAILSDVGVTLITIFHTMRIK